MEFLGNEKKGSNLGCLLKKEESQQNLVFTVRHFGYFVWFKLCASGMAKFYYHNILLEAISFTYSKGRLTIKGFAAKGSYVTSYVPTTGLAFSMWWFRWFDISLWIITCFNNSIQTQAPRLLSGKPWFCKEDPCSISFPSERNSSMDVFVVKY